MATSPDGYVLPPVSEAVSLYTLVAGEHGKESFDASASSFWIPGRQLVGYYVNSVLD